MNLVKLMSIMLLALGVQCSPTAQTEKKMKALIIDGENNHGVWPMTTMMMKDYLEQTGLFEVDIERTAYTWQGPHYDKSIGLDDITTLLKKYPVESQPNPEPVEEPKPDPNFKPDFSDYDVVISNFGWKASTWADEVRTGLEEFVGNGGGLVIVHAANNSFGDWEAYNRMIAVGGWGGRGDDYGYYIYHDENGELVKDPSVGPCGSHGPQMEYVLTTRAEDHPIMAGLPKEWLHTKDELYEKLRGPAENVTVLASAYSDPEGNAPPWNKEVSGSGHHEPLLLAIEFGEGRVFHTALGHMDYSMECVGFITTFQRGTEWAATGGVTIPVPDDFPTATQTSARKWGK